MISIDNKPIYSDGSDDDFTVDEYRKLIRIAMSSYQISSYENIPWGERFILWRHDCDHSLNRALVLGKIEAEEGLRSTYFLNPHCEFYNVLESAQSDIVRELIDLGHDIGLHLDGAYHSSISESDLNIQLKYEAEIIEHYFGIRPSAFSFHNPTKQHLECDEEMYGGLVNCYSKRFKSEVPYCSDSNGYWRFRRLRDVLEQASDPCLQVLTHPEWWQDYPMPPRQRIFRSVYGRARKIMASYDDGLQNWGRKNLSGFSEAIEFLKQANSERYELCDYLLNKGQLRLLCIELWSIHLLQIDRLCKAVLRKEWKVGAKEINELFDKIGNEVNRQGLFYLIFESAMLNDHKNEVDSVARLASHVEQLIQDGYDQDKDSLIEYCDEICRSINALTTLGRSHKINYDGVMPLSSIGLKTEILENGLILENLEEVQGDDKECDRTSWNKLKSSLLNVYTLMDE